MQCGADAWLKELAIRDQCHDIPARIQCSVVLMPGWLIELASRDQCQPTGSGSELEMRYT